MNPLNIVELQQNTKQIQTQMKQNWRPASYLSEMDERGNNRAAEAMASAYLTARFICNCTN